jgi:hypothetical protein
VLRLHPSHPNPARSAARIGFDLPSRGRVRLSIYDAAGRLTRTLADEQLDPGIHMRWWDARNDAGQRVASGVYFTRLLVDGRELRGKVVVLR